MTFSALSWSTQMLLWLSIPPHETYQGGLDSDDDLMSVWRDRLEHLQPLDIDWIKHQTRSCKKTRQFCISDTGRLFLEMIIGVMEVSVKITQIFNVPSY